MTWGYTSMLLPLDETGSNQAFWALPTRKSTGYALDEHFRIGNEKAFKRVCLYWLYFNDAGDHLCLAQQLRSCPLSLSVFSVGENVALHPEEPVLLAKRLKWMRDFEAGYPLRDQKEFELAFHPFEPLIVVAGRINTYMWSYMSGKSNWTSASRLLIVLVTSTTG
jgi:hypothetical protein